jgi:hypothetical protein
MIKNGVAYSKSMLPAGEWVEKAVLCYDQVQCLLLGIKLKSQSTEISSRVFENEAVVKLESTKIYEIDLDKEERVIGTLSDSHKLELAQHFDF